jgi:histidine ammonia-lyase
MFKIGEWQITPEDYKKILFEGETVFIDDLAQERIRKSFAFLETFHQDKITSNFNITQSAVMPQDAAIL